VLVAGELVTWRASDVPEQIFGRVGRIDVFIVGRDPESGYMLGTKVLFGADRGMIGFGSTRYSSTQEAQQAAEAEIARILAELDQLRTNLVGG
jgi:hypothetical protein